MCASTDQRAPGILIGPPPTIGPLAFEQVPFEGSEIPDENHSVQMLRVLFKGIQEDANVALEVPASRGCLIPSPGRYIEDHLGVDILLHVLQPGEGV